MRKSEKGISLIQLIIGLVVIIVIILMIRSFGKKDQPNKDIENSKISAEERQKLDEWNGVYTNGSYTITLVRNGMDKMKVLLEKFNHGILVATKNIELNSSSELMYDSKKKIQMKKTQSGLEFIVPENSDISEFKGEYDWQNFSKTGWSGVYVKDNYTIVLAELEEGRLNVTISSKLENWDTEVNEYTDSNIIYRGWLSGASQNLEITKMDDKIEVEASSDNKDSIFNKIDGIFTQIN